MTTIAWDGRTLAVDCQISVGNSSSKMSKLSRYEHGYIALYGDVAHSLLIRQWFLAGADPNTYPRTTETDKGFIVIATSCKIMEYVNGALIEYPYNCNKSWGSGRDYAMGAMHCGASAKRAVETACTFDCYTGFGVEYAHLHHREEPIL